MLYFTVVNVKSTKSSVKSVAKPSRKLLVQGLPDFVDEEYLEMFFEHTKRQGGGPVRSITINKKENFAVIEFEEADAIIKVLNKQPIKMKGTTVAVEMYSPYLENDEPLGLIELHGITQDLAKDIATMKCTSRNDPIPLTLSEFLMRTCPKK